MKWLGIFSTILAAMSVLIAIFIYSEADRMSRRAPDSVPFTKTGTMTAPNNSMIEFYEYKSKDLTCLVAVHILPNREAAFTQVNCK